MLFACSIPSSSVVTPAVAPPAVDAGACIVGPIEEGVRASFNLAPFYKQGVMLRGFPIVASEKPSPKALCVARDVIEKMTEARPELIERLIEKKIRLAIMATIELTTDIPEHADLTPKDYWDQRARGLGATLARPAVSAGEENVLCLAEDRYRGESILVHEFSHALFNIGIDLYEPALKAELNAAYADAKAAGRFGMTYAMENRDEYWAEGAQDWFDTNATAEPPNGIHGPIGTRSAVLAYDAPLSALLRKVFGDTPYRYTCPLAQ
jgi:hypothetical protein